MNHFAFWNQIENVQNYAANVANRVARIHVATASHVVIASRVATETRCATAKLDVIVNLDAIVTEALKIEHRHVAMLNTHGAAVSLRDASVVVIPFFAQVKMVAQNLDRLVVQNVDHCTGALHDSHRDDHRTL